MLKDTNERYGSITKILHWIVALLIGWQLLKFSDRIDEGEHWIGQTLVPWHVSIGSLLLLLIAARTLWAISQHSNRPEQDPAIAGLAKAGHGLLYAGMLLMPLTGIMAMLGGGYGITAFGVEFVSKGDEIAWASSIGELHSPLAWALTLLIVGHIGMGLIHHFIKRDNTLNRML